MGGVEAALGVGAGVFVVGEVAAAVGPVQLIGPCLDRGLHLVDGGFVAFEHQRGGAAFGDESAHASLGAVAAVLFVEVVLVGSGVFPVAHGLAGLVGVLGVFDCFDQLGVACCFAVGARRCVGEGVELPGGEVTPVGVITQRRVLPDGFGSFLDFLGVSFGAVTAGACGAGGLSWGGAGVEFAGHHLGFGHLQPLNRRPGLRCCVVNRQVAEAFEHDVHGARDRTVVGDVLAGEVEHLGYCHELKHSEGV